jgi:hypothetical protein
MASPVVRLNRASVIADTTGNVDAGAIRVTARRSLGMRRGSVISSSTSGLGRAGKLSIKAGELTLRRSRIQALAGLKSSGLTGGITIQARRWAKFENGSGISIANAASPERLDVDSGALRLMAPSLTLENSRITSSSTGNLAAGDIDLRFGPSLVLLSGLVTTEANTGNGGAIDLAGDGRIDLENSRITSSVAAGKGNGGDITVSAKDLLLSTGLIEAKAASGNGGRVSLNVRTLLASGNIINRRDVSLGDYLRNAAAAGAWQKEEFGNNVISAVSQSGLSGTIELASPQLNLSGALSNLGNPLFDTSEVRPDACRKEPGSTLTVEGRGGLPPRLRDWTLY